MCGINGIITNRRLEKEQLLKRLEMMNQKIYHRGPDQDGFFCELNKDHSIGMAMRRLSIIDLAHGEQPIYNDARDILIFFNGEIYNFPALKSVLIKKGYQFNTTSDTEVILRAYEEWGTDSFSMLDGMFTFSIYDKKKGKIFIARDFFGEKPLYYSQAEGEILWGSELKSLVHQLRQKPEISKKGLNLYFRLTYIPAPYTIYENVKKLDANHYITIDPEKMALDINPVRAETHLEIDPAIAFSDAKTLTQDLVMESVKSRSIADVPLGTFLSGGVDSSIVSLALAKQVSGKIDTFSVGFDKKSFDETDKSRTVAKLIDSNHHEFIISIDDLKDKMSDILLNFDEPFADSSSLPTYLVANKTREHVKVALTGDGGDELFGGYNKYYIGRMNEKYSSLIPQNFHNTFRPGLSNLLSTKDDKRGLRFKLRKLINSINYEGDFYYNIISLAFQQEELNEMLHDNWIERGIFEPYKKRMNYKASTLEDFRNIDRNISLEGDMLVKVDRTSMLTSLESRAPFLNKKLWDFTSQVPAEYLMKGWDKKYLLKEAFKEYFPEDFLNKSKKGFGVPVGDWLRDYLSDELKSYCEMNFLKHQNIFNIDYVKKLVNRHIEGKEDNTFKVWTFYCFQKWYKFTFQKLASERVDF